MCSTGSRAATKGQEGSTRSRGSGAVAGAGAAGAGAEGAVITGSGSWDLALGAGCSHFYFYPLRSTEGVSTVSLNKNITGNLLLLFF